MAFLIFPKQDSSTHIFFSSSSPFFLSFTSLREKSLGVRHAAMLMKHKQHVDEPALLGGEGLKEGGADTAGEEGSAEGADTVKEEGSAVGGGGGGREEGSAVRGGGGGTSADSFVF